MDVNRYYSELMFIFLNIFQQQKLMTKVILSETLFFRSKEKKRQKKILGYKFITINTSKHYDEDYEIGGIQTFISKFKNRQSRILEKESDKRTKEPDNKIKKSNFN